MQSFVSQECRRMWQRIAMIWKTPVMKVFFVNPMFLTLVSGGIMMQGIIDHVHNNPEWLEEPSFPFLIYAVPMLSLSISTQSTSWTLFQHRKDITQKPCTASRFIRCDYRITSPCYDGKLFNNTVYHQLHLKLCVNFTLAQWFPHSPTVQVQTQIHTLQQEYPGITLHDPMQPSKRKWAQHWPSSLKFHNAKNPCCREPPEEPHQ